MSTAYERALAPVPVRGTEGMCRCDGVRPHVIMPSCYLPGRPPMTGPGPVEMIPLWESDERVELADDEGYQRGIDQAEDCDEAHCPEDCNGFSSCHDDCLDVNDILRALRDAVFTKALRSQVATALGVRDSDVGQPRTRGVRL